MSKLLINEYPLQVLPTLAVLLGLQEAIALQQVHYWLITSKFEAEGRNWIYNTYEEWAAQFPFWSPEAVRKIFRSLKSQGVLDVKKLSSNNWDKTNYYAINYEKLASIAESSDAVKMAASNRSDLPINPVKTAASNRPDLPVHTTESTQETTTESFLAVGEKSPTAAKKKLSPEMKSACQKSWDAYSAAYAAQYGADPLWNAKVAGQVVQFVKRVGMEDAPHIAAWFPSHKASLYVAKGHTIGVLLLDAEKLRTEWATGRSMTATKARQSDRTGSNMDALEQVLAERGESLQQGGAV